jgi:hypothetical protein
MARIRITNLRREEVDTVDEVQRTFNDVYRVLREQQKEITELTPPAAVPVKTDAPAVKPKKPGTQKESKQ